MVKRHRSLWATSVGHVVSCSISASDNDGVGSAVSSRAARPGLDQHSLDGGVAVGLRG
jgi:hypothetical protein